MHDATVFDGVHNFMREYVQPTGDDFILVAYSPDSRETAAIVLLAARELGAAAEYVSMLPIRDPGLLERLNAALPGPRGIRGRLVLLTFERDTMSHDRVFKEALRPYDREKYVVFRAISSCAELLSTALMASPIEMDALNATLLKRLMNSSTLHIETRGGSSVDVRLDNARHQWVSNRGIPRPGRIVILPAGEIATFPADVNGTFVADFAFNLNAITDRDTRLNNTPVKVVVEGGKAVHYECSDPEIMTFLDQCFRKICASNVGELGFGTNRMIKSPISMNSHINERRPGIHLGFGQHNQDPGVVPYQCDLHLDLVADGGLVWVDNDPMPIDMETFEPLQAAHPNRFRDEDIFSPDLEDLDVEDCCGILRKGEMHIFQLDEK